MVADAKHPLKAQALRGFALPDIKPPFRFWNFFFSLNGRVSRLAMWTFILPWRLLAFAALLGLQAWSHAVPMTLKADHTPNYPAWYLLQAGIGLFSLFMAWPTFAVRFKRLHDVRLTGLPALVTILPITVQMVFSSGLIFMATKVLPHGAHSLGIIATAIVWLLDLALAVVPGTRGPNRYGPDPLASSGAQDVF